MPKPADLSVLGLRRQNHLTATLFVVNPHPTDGQLAVAKRLEPGRDKRAT